MVEDSIYGVHVVHAAGIRFIGFAGASRSYPAHAGKLTDAGTETAISRMNDFPGVVAAPAASDCAIELYNKCQYNSIYL
ncbi:beta-phosphoglucomutase-like phosphatase (HAD superfamily) [Rhizobium esperanzae]|uniref:Beta-phosphoglucomutase-like phosphatase (HAD superfamily) n=1 Tax=Rhizobium esperanzae TaxID=1967781 RepID=A0A7W6R9L4_9HYPH|nr:beta-phosphoglucomutase-like phosphatase (HAD superfamily) [Rhizobium esperanzae]